jgi:hypothetical protein
MAYSDFKETLNKFLAGWQSFAKGESASPTLDVKISTAYELNALKNSTSANQMIQLGNAYYDQVAIGRTITELYKTPKDYYQQFVDSSTSDINAMNDLGNLTETQHKNVENSIAKSRSFSALSPSMKKKLARIKSEFDA